MAVLEAIQFTIGLTKDKAILKQLKTNRMWRKDDKGEYLSLQFDGQEFKFRHGITYTLNKTVANALIRSSAVIVGSDALSDPIMPYLEKVGESELGMRTVAKYACPICGEDQATAPRLTRHLMKRHKDDPEMQDKSGGAVDFDTPLDEQLKSGDSFDGGEDTESFGAEKEQN